MVATTSRRGTAAADRSRNSTSGPEQEDSTATLVSEDGVQGVTNAEASRDGNLERHRRGSRAKSDSSPGGSVTRLECDSSVSDATVFMDDGELFDSAMVSSLWTKEIEQEWRHDVGEDAIRLSLPRASKKKRPASAAFQSASDMTPGPGMSLADWSTAQGVDRTTDDKRRRIQKTNADLSDIFLRQPQHLSPLKEGPLPGLVNSEIVSEAAGRIHAVKDQGRAAVATRDQQCSNPACCNPQGRWLPYEHFAGTTTAGHLRVFKTCGHCRNMDAEKKRKKRAKQEELHAVKNQEIARLNQELATLKAAHAEALKMLATLRSVAEETPPISTAEN